MTRVGSIPTSSARVFMVHSNLKRRALITWEDNGGCLPALDAGGRKFESCFSDFCSVRIMVSTPDFLSGNRGSIPLQSTK